MVRNLEGANQYVPDDLMELAMQSSWFRKSRFKTGKGKSMSNIGGVGLGFRERKGFGSSSGTGPSTSTFGKSFVPVSTSDDSSSSNSSSSLTSPKNVNRLSALKEAFKMQYNSQFRVSTDKTWEQTLPTEGVFQKPPPPPNSDSSGSESKKTKKSRWN